MTAHDVPSGRPATVDTPSAGDPRLSRLSLNQRTTANWPVDEAIEGCRRAGLTSIGLWREPVAQAGLDAVRSWLDAAGLRVSSLCRGGFFTDPARADETHKSNVTAIDEAAALGAPALVLVPGGLPEGSRDLPAARDSVASAIERLAPYARDRGVTLAIEPMNPIYAADRGVISTLAQALDIAESIDEGVGVVVDAFHVWWEPGIEEQILRAGPRIASYQVCDWITPLPPDSLLARGMMGDGHVDFAALTRAVARAGYAGDVEVEIFNADVWAAAPERVVATMARRYVELVEPHL